MSTVWTKQSAAGNYGWVAPAGGGASYGLTPGMFNDKGALPLLAWSWDPTTPMAINRAVNGTIQWVMVNVPAPITVTNVIVFCAGIPTTVTPNVNFVGIYQPTVQANPTPLLSSLTRLAQSAAGAIDGLQGSNGLLSFPLSAPVALTPGIYFAALLFAAATTPNLLTLVTAGGNGIAVNGQTTWLPYAPGMQFYQGSTSLPASQLVNGINGATTFPWVAFS